MRGRLVLIPAFLSEVNDENYLSEEIKSIIKEISYFLVENIRTSRRFLSSLKMEIDISSLSFETMDKNFDPSKLRSIFKPIFEGNDIGVISEAGLPGIADPGSMAVQFAHKENIEVIPLPGASSIILGLISSGMNGQQFIFHGYPPIEKVERIKMIKKWESEVSRTGYTQIFMETPYRNDSLLRDLVSHLHQNTDLFIGRDISGSGQFCKTQTIKEWRKELPDLKKVPTIFALGIA